MLFRGRIKLMGCICLTDGIKRTKGTKTALIFMLTILEYYV